MAGNWIADATSKNKGAFSAAAKRAGQSTAAHAKSVLANPDASPTQKKRAALAKTLMAMRRHKKVKKAGKKKD